MLTILSSLVIHIYKAHRYEHISHSTHENNIYGGNVILQSTCARDDKIEAITITQHY